MEPEYPGIPSVREEFIDALEHEIDAVTRQSRSMAISLVNGRRIGQVAAAYQYVFDLTNALNIPGDSPGNLIVSGRSPLEATVISTEGLSITLSISEDLGVILPEAALQSDLTFLLRKLIQRIKDKGDSPNPAGDRALGLVLPEGDPIPVFDSRLNRAQIAAVASSLGRDTTFIWGPPGCGKTLTIGKIGEELYKRNRPLLLVSHTNSAVDEALLRIGSRVPQDELEKGWIVRVGIPRNPRLRDSNPELRLDTHVKRRSEELTRRQAEANARLLSARAEANRISRLIEISEWVEQAQGDIREMEDRLFRIKQQTSNADTLQARNEKLLAEQPTWEAASQEARSCLNEIKRATQLKRRATSAEEVFASVENQFSQARHDLDEAERMLEQTESVNRLVRLWRGLPAPEAQRAVVGQLRRSFDSVDQKRDQAAMELETIKNALAQAKACITSFEAEHHVSAAEILERAANHSAELKETSERAKQVRSDARDSMAKLRALLISRTTALREWELTAAQVSSVESMLEAVREAYAVAQREIDGFELPGLQSNQQQLNLQIHRLQAEIKEIDEALRKVEQEVIAAAKVVATTLTITYLRDSVQSRSFDTVLLDEASMAPIPALWCAAGLADVNVVIVGDFKQLPPIVISDDPISQKWLGRDIFTVAGQDDTSSASPDRINLSTQYRMHPRISEITSTLFYDGLLNDAVDTLRDSNPDQWYERNWAMGMDAPVLLIDTGSLGAWVTSVARGTGASRLNFLSATLCVDLAERMLAEGRTTIEAGARPHILIVSPYRPHASLVALLLRDMNLSGEVLSGTAHSFQGAEADVVILDLVNDEPHWRVAMFNPDRDQALRPVLNVALTRAKKRLVIIGDFEYISKQGKKAFVGSQLLPFLMKRHRVIDALKLAPVELSAKAAKAQTKVFGGTVEPSERRIVVANEQFYAILRADFSQARNRAVVYSPFMTEDRLNFMAPQLRAAAERGVRIFVVTKPLQERGRNEEQVYRRLEGALGDWGVTVIHKSRMHEKLVFLDDNILWSGSLNPLSFRNTQEVMERRDSRDVVGDYVKTLRCEDLIAEYANGGPTCPVCRSEVMPREGGKDPFFWKCVRDNCYTRSIDEPPLEDRVTCSTCGGSVTYGTWDSRPTWNRCSRKRLQENRS